MNLVPPVVCVVTRARGGAGSPERATLLRRLSSAAAAGASMIQVRERHLDDRALLEFLRDLIAITARTGCLVTVNDRIDLAIAAGAAGVHLKDDGMLASDARMVVPPSFVVGRSVHSPEDAVEVERAGGCDYLLFGTVFPSASKSDDHPVAGIDALRRVCESTPLPVLAIGGVSPSRAAAVAEAGAFGAAAISYFADANDVAEAVSILRTALTRHSGHAK